MMYVVDIHPKYGVVAAPEELSDIDGAAVEALFRRGFQWNDAEGMFAAPVADAEAADDLAACTIAALVLAGHPVLIVGD